MSVSLPHSPQNLIAYYRVSTGQRQFCRLGLEGQRQQIQQYAAANCARIIKEYTEAEIGKTANRPELKKALDHARITRAKLVIVSLDRLSRSVAFISRLMESGVSFEALDFPNSDLTMLHIYAVFSEAEARKVSKRTKIALASAKALGVKLGNPNPSKDTSAATAARLKSMSRHRESIKPVIQPMHERGFGFTEIARQLNEQGIRPFRGRAWYASSIRQLIQQLKI